MDRLLDHFCSRFTLDQLCHPQPRQLLLIGGAHIRRERRIGAMAGDRFDLFIGATGVGEPRRRRFAQAVRGTLRQAGFIAAIPKPPDVNGAPCSVSRNVRFERGNASNACINSGCSGIGNDVSVFS